MTRTEYIIAGIVVVVSLIAIWAVFTQD